MKLQIGHLTEDKSALIKHLLKVNVAALLTVLITFVFIDAKVVFFFARGWGEQYRTFFGKITDVGLADTYFLITVFTFFAMSALHKYHKHHRLAELWAYLKNWASLSFFTLLGSGLFVQLLKHVVGRKRPYEEPLLDHLVFKPFVAKWEYHSFPSGHSQVMFTVATLMTLIFPRQFVFWYGFAGFIALTRAFVTDHFLSDVIYGSTLGYSMSLIVIYWLRRSQKNNFFLNDIDIVETIKDVCGKKS